MTLRIKCPGCNRALKVADSAAGKKIRCPACKEVFAVKAKVSPPVEDGQDLVEEEDSAPSEPSEEKITSRPPSRTAGSARQRQRELNDEDEEEVRPRKRRPPVKKSKSHLGLVLGLAGGLLVLLVIGVGVGAFLFIRQVEEKSTKPPVALNSIPLPTQTKGPVDSPRSIPESAWKEFAPPGAGFSLLMPGTPVSPPLPPMMAMANARTYAVEVKEPDSGFGIIYFELPEDEWEKLPMEQRFALIRQGIAAKSPATAVVADKKITLNGNSGREHVLKDPEKGTLVVRFYAIRPRIFILFAGGKNFQPNSPEIEKFFSSFRLLKK